MANTNVGDVARIVINGRIHGQNTINVLHFKAQNSGPTLLQGLITAIVACIVEELLPRLSSEWTYEGVKATVLSGEFDEIIRADESASGGVQTDALPSLIAAVIRFHTARRGRSGRGRMYIAGALSTSEDDSQWENPDVTFGDFLECLLRKFVGIGGAAQEVPDWKLAVLSRKDIAGGISISNAAHPVVGGSVNGDVCTMRSRKLGHGT